jgi:hypothetical protein
LPAGVVEADAAERVVHLQQARLLLLLLLLIGMDPPWRRLARSSPSSPWLSSRSREGHERRSMPRASSDASGCESILVVLLLMETL